MEYQFETVGRVDLPMHLQLYRITLRPIIRLGRIIFFVFAGYMALMGLMEQDPARIITAVLYCLVPVAFGKIPKFAADHAYKERLKYYDGESPETFARFGEEILLEDVDSWRKVPYHKVTQVHFMQGAIGLMVGKQMVVAIPHETFLKGSLPELKLFLRENCTNAQFF